MQVLRRDQERAELVDADSLVSKEEWMEEVITCVAEYFSTLIYTNFRIALKTEKSRERDKKNIHFGR